MISASKQFLILENMGTKWNKKVTWFNHESSHFLFHFFDHWLSLAIPLWLPCSYDIDLNTVFLMQDSTNFVAKLSSPIVNDNTWSEISAVDMLVKKFCNALCSWARYGSKENTFQNCVNLLRRCHKNIWFKMHILVVKQNPLMPPCKSYFIYAKK